MTDPRKEWSPRHGERPRAAQKASTKGASTKRPRKKTIDLIGVMLLICGVVLGMAVAWIQGLAMGLQIGLLILALILVVVGLVLNRRFRLPD